MKLSSGKRIGQSGQELLTATVFSFVLHGLVLAASVFLYFTVTPRVYVPPFYQVKLVGLPAEVSQAQPAAPAAPAAPALPKKPEIKTPKTTPKAKPFKERKAPAKMNKSAMPGLASSRKQPKPEIAKAEEKAETREPAANKSRREEAAPVAADAQGVAVATDQQDFKFGWYLAVVRERIGHNWHPQISVQGSRARVVFTINRSGWVDNPRLDEEHTSADYSFKLAAIRAIQTSNPFPPLPDEFSKQTLEFSVDLTPKE